jgi:ATP-binding cassette subfamily B protein
MWSSFSHTPRTLGLVWETSKSGTTLLAGLTLLSASFAVASVWMGKLIIDAVVAARSPRLSGHRGDAVSAVVELVAIQLAIMVASALVDRTLEPVRQLLGSRFGIEVNLLILRKATSLELRHFEDPGFYDKMTRARREASTRPLAMLDEIFRLARSGLTLAAYAAVLFRFSPWAALGLMVTALPSFASELCFSTKAFKLLNWRSPEARQLSYLDYVLGTENHAKEVRLFDLGPSLIARYKRLAETFESEDRALATRRSIWNVSLSLLSVGAYYACYLAAAVAAATSRCTIGAMTLYVAAFRQGRNAFDTILGAVGGMYEDNLYMANLFEYLDVPVAPLSRPRHAHPRRESGIRFEGVTFRYPDSDQRALNDVSFFVPAGETLAVVGRNGAGKTTLIKLLTRLYDPTEGSIWVDGIDIADWDAQKLRARFSVIFQDFSRFHFSLRENIGVGDLEHMRDDARILRAMQKGGADALMPLLPKGIDTQLGRTFAEGVGLSGGQWQKVALARAFMREEADIFILDEPTAALDADAEQALFERFKGLVRGRTAILITHRFSTARIADQILVMEGGAILERGTHGDLIANDGMYAKLFSLQAAGYR